MSTRNDESLIFSLLETKCVRQENHPSIFCLHALDFFYWRKLQSHSNTFINWWNQKRFLIIEPKKWSIWQEMSILKVTDDRQGNIFLFHFRWKIACYVSCRHVEMSYTFPYILIVPSFVRIIAKNSVDKTHRPFQAKNWTVWVDFLYIAQFNSHLSSRATPPTITNTSPDPTYNQYSW